MTVFVYPDGEIAMATLAEWQELREPELALTEHHEPSLTGAEIEALLTTYEAEGV